MLNKSSADDFISLRAQTGTPMLTCFIKWQLVSTDYRLLYALNESINSLKCGSWLYYDAKARRRRAAPAMPLASASTVGNMCTHVSQPSDVIATTASWSPVPAREPRPFRCAHTRGGRGGSEVGDLEGITSQYSTAAHRTIKGRRPRAPNLNSKHAMTNQGQQPGLFQLEIPGVFFFTLRVHLQRRRLQMQSRVVQYSRVYVVILLESI
eukprot:1194968-Prorocentrum_minimum.AAC.3